MLVRTPKNAKFLIIRFSAFGDVVQTLSVPAGIRQAYPEAEIHFITRKDMAPLLKNHPALQRIWEFDRKDKPWHLVQLAWRMRREKFTHIYDAHNNMRSRLVVWTLRPLGFLGFGAHFIRRSIRRWKRFLLFRFRVNTFEMPFSGQRDLLEPLQPWGISKQAPPAPQIFPSTESLRQAQDILQSFQGAIALAPSAAYFLKRWPKDHWKELIRLLPEEKFVLLGGPEDSFIEEIHQAAAERTLNLAGRCSLPVSAAVVALSPILVSNDTGLLHVAEQRGTPAIALMGPAPFGFPSRPTTRVLEIHLPCRPCSKHGQGPCVNKDKFHQCLVDITPAQVAQELRRLKELL